MRFASIRDFRASVSSVLSKGVIDDTVVVTLRGKPVALFVPIQEAQLEEMAQAIKTARLRSSIDKLRLEARKASVRHLSQAEIEKEIKEARKAKRA